MLKKSWISIILLLFLLINTTVSSTIVNASEVKENNLSQKSFISKLLATKSLDRIIHPLNNIPLELSNEDLDVLSYMSNCKVVGLGEATHGTKEFFQLKHRIFKYLVENHEYKIFAFECDMGESYYINNFINEGEGDIDHLMKNIMHFWTWRTEEVKDLLIWMKDYNENKSEEEKIHFIGVDCQFLTYQADIIMSYFDKTNISLPESSLQFLTEIDQIGWNISDYYSDITLGEKEAIDDKVNTLLTKFEDLKNELISNSSEFEYKFVNQIALNIKQINDVLYGYKHNSLTNYRDLYMAQNTLWTTDLFGGNTKVALWAHNAHVANSESFEAMGLHLKEELQDDYQIIGFSFSVGSFTAVRTGLAGLIVTPWVPIKIWKPRRRSINYVFHHAKYDNFILRALDIQEKSAFGIFISQPQRFLNIGAGFNRLFYLIGFYHSITELMQEYDVVIHWDKTEAAEQLN